MYLFSDKQLKLSTIAGYRSAIADGLGSSGNSISKSREISRLINSFYRDRPRTGRAIPSWDISVVLLAMPKQLFEPLSEAVVKLLTYKSVFLLAGKHRSETHAWLHSSVFFNHDGSKVTVPAAFLSRNQLASTAS